MEARSSLNQIVPCASTTASRGRAGPSRSGSRTTSTAPRALTRPIAPARSTAPPGVKTIASDPFGPGGDRRRPPLPIERRRAGRGSTGSCVTESAKRAGGAGRGCGSATAAGAAEVREADQPLASSRVLGPAAHRDARSQRDHLGDRAARHRAERAHPGPVAVEREPPGPDDGVPRAAVGRRDRPAQRAAERLQLDAVGQPARQRGGPVGGHQRARPGEPGR